LPPQLTVLGQFLSTAVASICRRANVAPSLTSTASDVRDLVAYRLGLGGADPDQPPTLARGWRAEVVGHAVEDLLSGRTSIRIRDPLADDPLVFETAPADDSA
jgi:ribonuclease D